MADFFIVTARREKLDQLASILSEGDVEVAVAATFPLYEVGWHTRAGADRGAAAGKTVSSSMSMIDLQRFGVTGSQPSALRGR